ncbi:hypothetical protein [Natronomonas sp.]|uniref:hypothetical protein n=1 Tax=Natronomonas sp. TaxID=2184060 RepID=UPI002635D5F5|nr:hypothetical protein [Natronomonas sp.]
MLGLRYFACERCETVVAEVEAPVACRECGASEIGELTGEGSASEYFAPSGRGRDGGQG